MVVREANQSEPVVWNARFTHFRGLDSTNQMVEACRLEQLTGGACDSVAHWQGADDTIDNNWQVTGHPGDQVYWVYTAQNVPEVIPNDKMLWILNISRFSTTVK